jgi:hypothetical protein
VYGASLRQFKSDSKQQGKEGPFKRKKGLKTSWAFFVELSTSESVNVKRKKDTFRVTIVHSRQCDVQILCKFVFFFGEQTCEHPSVSVCVCACKVKFKDI